MQLETMKTYILHCKRLEERKPHILAQVKKAGLTNYEFFLDHDAEELTPELLEKYYDGSPESWYRKFLPYLYQSVAPHRILNPGITSLNIKHACVYELISQRDDDVCMILEDDVVFLDDEIHRFKNELHNLPEDFDLIFFGSGCGLRINSPEPNKYFHRKFDPATKCTDSMIITKSAAEKLAKAIVPFTLPIDFELNYHINQLGLKVYWTEPPCTVQGSQQGMFTTTCSQENHGIEV